MTSNRQGKVTWEVWVSCIVFSDRISAVFVRFVFQQSLAAIRSWWSWEKLLHWDIEQHHLKENVLAISNTVYVQAIGDLFHTEENWAVFLEHVWLNMNMNNRKIQMFLSLCLCIIIIIFYLNLCESKITPNCFCDTN